MTASRSYKADDEAVAYLKHVATGFRFSLTIAVASLLFVYSQGKQITFAPTEPGAFLLSLLTLAFGAALSLVGYIGTDRAVGRLLLFKALGEDWRFDYGWRQMVTHALHWLAMTATIIGVTGLVLHYFFQWFAINQPAMS